VVLGTRGRSGIERLLLGSMADGVARRSKIPVVLVP
jgi:nucleotide-binding universal stress UspA family protein